VRDILSSNDSESSCDCWSRLSDVSQESQTAGPPFTRKRSASSIARLKSWEQSIKRNPRNGGVGANSGSVGHCQWLPTATIEEFKWAGDPDTSLSIRKENPHSSLHDGHRVEIDVANLLRAIVCRTEEEHGVVKEYLCVARLDRRQPEMMLRRVTTHQLGGDALDQQGHASSFGDPLAVADLFRRVAERAGSGADAVIRALHTVQGDDPLVARAVEALEELTA